MTSEENTFPQFVESLLGLTNAEDTGNPDPISELASVNQCLTKQSLRDLHRKLVRFDCQICDMFEEEYFVPVVPKI